MPLKPRHASFLKAYLSNGHNSAAAARAAGYSERSAPQTGSALLKRPDIAAQLALAAGKTEKSLALTAERVMAELATIALFDPATMYDPETGELLPVAKMPEATRRAIAGVEHEVNKGTTKLRISSKLGGLELISKILHLVQADNLHQTAVSITIAAPPVLPERQDNSRLLPEW